MTPLIQAAILAGAALLGACGTLEPSLPPGWALQTLPAGEGQSLQALERAPLQPPQRQRQRVIVIPGSGCAGMGAFAPRYFAGLRHSQVLVLHKPGVSAFATTTAADCGPAFVQADHLSAWLASAQAALGGWLARQPSALPTWLVGISEGAELLPGLAPLIAHQAGPIQGHQGHVQNHLAGLVLLSSSGLDPREAAFLQAQRLGQEAPWQALEAAQAGSAPDSTIVQGRSLRYWRDLWHWPLAQDLIDSPWPIWQVWGAADALIPQSAYTAFAQRAQGRRAPYCAWRLPGADHGLQRPGSDGVQLVWAAVEGGGDCQGPGAGADFSGRQR